MPRVVRAASAGLIYSDSPGCGLWVLSLFLAIELMFDG